MKPFILKRTDIAEKIGKCPMLEFFDRVVLRDPKNLRAGGQITLPGGWTPDISEKLMRQSPRALWLLAKNEMIPVSEKQALEMIVKSGRRIEDAPLARAKTRPVGGKDAELMALRIQASLPSRGPNTRTPEVLRIR